MRAEARENAEKWPFMLNMQKKDQIHPRPLRGRG